MKYRNFGKIPFQPSALGFGLMRLPMQDKEKGIVDLDEAIRIVHHAVDQGVNYLDTAYIYHRMESEKILGEIVKDGYREKVKIATKLPLWMIKDEADLDKIFFEQLEKMKIDKIDFYLFHAVNAQRLQQIKELKMIDWIEKKKSQGYLDYIGFSFHDSLKIFKKSVDYYNWDFCQIQYNITDVREQAGLTGLRYAHKKGLGVIIMEPLRGGQLTESISPDIMKLWHKFADSGNYSDFSPIQFMLDWIWDQEEPGLILSGMSDMSQVQQNLSFADHSSIHKLNDKQREIIKSIRRTYFKKRVIPCTFCQYCSECPKKIDIPYIFDLLNQIKKFENIDKPRIGYKFIPEENSAGKCIDCKLCDSLCPQQIKVSENIKKAKSVFEDLESFDKYF